MNYEARLESCERARGIVLGGNGGSFQSAGDESQGIVFIFSANCAGGEVKSAFVNGKIADIAALGAVAVHGSGNVFQIDQRASTDQIVSRFVLIKGAIRWLRATLGREDDAPLDKDAQEIREYSDRQQARELTLLGLGTGAGLLGDWRPLGNVERFAEEQKRWVEDARWHHQRKFADPTFDQFRTRCLGYEGPPCDAWIRSEWNRVLAYRQFAAAHENLADETINLLYERQRDLGVIE